MNNKLGQNFNFFSLIKFASPTMCMMIFSALYIMVDAVFVSRFISTNALSALNIVYPLYSVVFAVAIMFAAGGSALVAKKMGEQKHNKAKSYFSLIVLASIIFGVIFSIICLIFIKQIIYMLGATDEIYDYCYRYIVPILIFTPLCILQIIFQSFFIVSGRPNLGFAAAIVGGVSNIVFDYIFIILMNMGIIGAAFGSIVGFFLQTLIGTVYFLLNKNGTLYFVKPSFNLYVVLKSCYNGMSEMIGNLAISVTTFLFNITTIKYAGINGVAAITIILYAEYMLTSIFYGYSNGVAPVFSYNYGFGDIQKLKNIFKISMKFVIVESLIIAAVAIPLAPYIINIFSQYNKDVFDLTLQGFYMYCPSFLFIGVNIFVSTLFIAFSNGKVASIISILRTFIFISIFIIVLPIFLGINGVWLAIPATELLSIIVAIYYLFKYKKVYNY